MLNLSVLIPARNEPFLENTVHEVLSKATGDVECLVWGDGYEPDIHINDDRLRVFHSDEPIGNVKAVNLLAWIAQGKHIMKLDAHCALQRGYDEILTAICQPTWLVVPARYSLDVEHWLPTGEATHYQYLTFPYQDNGRIGYGFHGKPWRGKDGLHGRLYQRECTDNGTRVDDIMIAQGSCWLMQRERFIELDGYDEAVFHYQEPVALMLKAWLSEEGRCVVAKDVWYAHLHKTEQSGGRGYRLSRRRKHEDEAYSADYWMNNRWEGRARDFRWYVEHFWPIPGWPKDWDALHYQSAAKEAWCASA